jgi:hypothetical protein
MRGAARSGEMMRAHHEEPLALAARPDVAVAHGREHRDRKVDGAEVLGALAAARQPVALHPRRQPRQAARVALELRRPARRVHARVVAARRGGGGERGLGLGMLAQAAGGLVLGEAKPVGRRRQRASSSVGSASRGGTSERPQSASGLGGARGAWTEPARHAQPTQWLRASMTSRKASSRVAELERGRRTMRSARSAARR